MERQKGEDKRREGGEEKDTEIKEGKEGRKKTAG